MRMAEEIKGQIKYDASVHAIDFDTNTVTTKEGETGTCRCDHFYDSLDGICKDHRNAAGVRRKKSDI